MERKEALLLMGAMFFLGAVLGYGMGSVDKEKEYELEEEE